MKLYRSVFAALTLLLLVAFAPLAGTASAQGPGDFVLGETSVVVPANGETSLSFQTFCLDFGKEFPSVLGTPDGRADDSVLKVVKTALENDTADSNPLAVQLAIWTLREGETLEQLYPDTELEAGSAAQQLVDEADDASVSPLRTDRGIALDEAVANGTIEATSEDFRFVETDKPRPDDEPYHGEGTLVLRNTTDQDVEVYFPFGIVFEPTNDSEQAIVAYATELEQLPTPTPMPTATPEPTPATIPETGAPDGDVTDNGRAPWLLIAAGLVMLTSAGFLITRYQEQ